MSNHSPKKRVHDNLLECETPPFGLPRKKFISEESFAREMAAMSLDPMQQQQQQHLDFQLSDDDDSSENDLMPIDTDGKTLINVDQNGLPMEIRPGENKPRIPTFVLDNPELTDPRDIMAYQNILKSLHTKHHKHKAIEVLNNPSDYFTPTSMDID